MSIEEYIIAFGDSAFQRREEIVRCRDCEHYDEYFGSCMRRYHHFAAELRGMIATEEG